MENLSNSLTKFVSKIGEVRRRNSGAAEAAATRTAPRTRTAPCDSPSPKPPPRPGSPFLMLLMEGEEEEFQYNRKQEQNEATTTGEQNECDNNLFRDSALGSSTSLDKIVGKQQSPDSSKRQEDIEHVHISPDQLEYASCFIFVFTHCYSWCIIQSMSDIDNEMVFQNPFPRSPLICKVYTVEHFFAK